MSRLAPNVVASIATVALVVATGFISVPVILGAVGQEGFGAWTLGQTLLIYVSTAESGIGPAVQRFVAAGLGAGDEHAARRLLWSSIILYSGVGLIVAGLLYVLAPTVVDVVGLHGGVRESGIALYRLLGIAMALALAASAFGNVQQGLGRFVPYAFSSVVSSAAFLVALLLFLEADLGLRGIAYAAIVQQAVLLLARAGASLDVLRGGPAFSASAERRAVLAFAARLQMTVLSLLVNTQTDKLVVSAVATPRALAQLGIGSQLAEAGRVLGGAALSPIISAMSVTHGEGDPAVLRTLFSRLNRAWTVATTGGVVIGGACLAPLIRAWLGDGYGEAALLGTFLVVGYGLSLLTGPAVAYLRAVGRPGTEARLGVVLIVANVTLTVVLGVLLGALGVVIATAAAYLAGTVWFLGRVRRVAPELEGVQLLPGPLDVLGALLAGGAAAAFALLMAAVLPLYVALVPIAIGMGVAFVAYVLVTLRVRPTPSALRAALTGA